MDNLWWGKITKNFQKNFYLKNYLYITYMGKPKCEKKCEKKIVKKGKAKWKRMLDELKEQTIIFYDNHYETIDEETKWMIEFIVRNFEKFIRRNKSIYLF